LKKQLLFLKKSYESNILAFLNCLTNYPVRAVIAKGSIMKTNFLLKIVNPILAVVFLFQITSGLMHGIISHELFGTIHGSSAGVLMACVLIYLILNWYWIKANFLKKK
jgi:hypothetical protein